MNISPKLLLEELFYGIESVPSWNPTLVECRTIQPIDEHTDISYQVLPSFTCPHLSPITITPLPSSPVTRPHLSPVLSFPHLSSYVTCPHLSPARCARRQAGAWCPLGTS